MAIVTNVRVESTAPESVTIRWTDNGGASNKIYRSTDGFGASNDLVATVALGVEVYEDTTVSADTEYQYIITNDNGATYTGYVFVHTQKCDFTGSAAPRTVSPDPTDEDFVDHLNKLLNPSSLDDCYVCPVEGHIVIDCTLGCRKFIVDEITEDINSITINGCDGCPDIDFVIPAGATIGICGWPVGADCSRDGDECFQSPVEGGDNGRTSNSNGASRNSDGVAITSKCICASLSRIACKQSGPWRLTAGWYCEPVRTSANFDYECWWECEQHGSILLKACGGTAPYTWSTVNIENNPTGQADYASCVVPGCVSFSVNPTNEAQTTRATPDSTYGSGGNDCSQNHEIFGMVCTDAALSSIVICGWEGL